MKNFHSVESTGSSRAIWLAATVVLLLAFSTVLPRISASVAGNLGWLALIQAEVEQAEVEPTSEPVTGRAWSEAFSWFYQPARGAPLNRSGYTGAGIFFAQNGRDDLALAAWSAAETDPAWLVNLGDFAVDAGKPETAMRFFRGADDLTNGEWPRAHLSLGRLCQRALYGSGTFDDDQRQLCRNYFADGNLILNGGFETGDLLTWVKHTHVNALPVTFGFDAADGMPAPSLILTGTDDRTSGGLYQPIVLPARTRVLFSLRARMQPIAEGQAFEAHLLVVGLVGRGDVRTVDAPAALVAGDDWRYFEHVFETPNRENGLYYFYPATIRGNGSVWIDDVQAEILPWPLASCSLCRGGSPNTDGSPQY